MKSNEQLKKEGRGIFDSAVSSNGLVATRWMDSESFTTISSYIGTGNTGNVKRWSRKEKAHIEVPCLEVIQHYNRFVEGANCLDQLIASNRISL